MATTTNKLGLRKPALTDIVDVQTDLNDNFDKLDTPLYSAEAATDDVVGAKVDGDAQRRFNLNADGKVEWGSGAAVSDVNLYRDSAGVIKTDGGLIVVGALTMPDGTVVTSKLGDGAVTTAKLNAAIYGGNGAAATLARSDHEHSEPGLATAVRLGIDAGGSNFIVFSGENQDIAWNEEDFDNNGPMHDNAVNNSRITVPAGKGGMWLVGFHLHFQIATPTVGNSVSAFLAKNGLGAGSPNYETFYETKSSSDTDQVLDFVGPCNANAGDYFEVTASEFHTNTVNLMTTYSSFWATWLGPTS